MSHRRIDRKGVLLVTLGGGVAAGVLMLLHDVLVLGYRGGVFPVWVGVLFPRLRSRYVLDGSDDVEAALDRARARWPEDGDQPTRLLQRLIELGDARLTESVDERALQRRSAIARTSGAVPGLYPKGHLEQLRRDWPD